jgi:phosphoglycolate phosphatase-like HAD superfamily hydrolase
MLKAILFDFDGVLVESVDIKTKAFAKIFESEGPEVVKLAVEYHLANGGISRYKKFEYIYEKVLKRNITDETKEKLGDTFQKLVMGSVLDAHWVHGAREFLEKYYTKYDFYVVSGTPDSEIKYIVDKRNMGKYFKGVYGSPCTKGELIKQIIQDNEYRKNQLVFIGDAITDLKGAFEADIRFIGRTSIEHNLFLQYNVPVISNFEDLPYMINEIEMSEKSAVFDE